MYLRPESLTDFYKTGHIKQYPPGTQLVYSNWTIRGAKFFKGLPDYDNKYVFFGAQGMVQDLLIETWNNNFFKVPRDVIAKRFARRMDLALGPNVVDVSKMLALHDLGYLPLSIKALPEGSRVNVRVACMTFVNTHPDFYWLTNYVETQVSAYLWQTITNATMAYEFRRLLERYAHLTGSDREFVKWQGHDFSYRGMASNEAAITSGAAHLLSFTGTDTVPALDYLDDYYEGDYPPTSNHVLGGSVPATEHSVMCMGTCDGELETYERLITETYPEGVVSIVSDTWDFWQVVTDYTRRLKDKIVARNGKVVLRPDSGDPVKILCGEAWPLNTSPYTDGVRNDYNTEEFYEATRQGYRFVTYKGLYWTLHELFNDENGAEYELNEVQPTPAMKGAVTCLWEVFGGTTTNTGHKLLDGHVGLIYGDSISLERASLILELLAAKGFASGNVVFGVGSYTYQFNTRDTLAQAIKATYGIVNDEARELFKLPKTDDGTKTSARGLIRVEQLESGDFMQYDQQTLPEEEMGALRVIFMNSQLFNHESVYTIRDRLHDGNW